MSQRTFNFTIAFCAWLVAAAAIGSTGIFRSLPPPAVQVTIVVLTALLLIFYAKWRSFREFVRELPLKVLILLHVSRLVGLYFLILYRQDKLPGEWAIPAGFGDIAVAATAIGILCLPLESAFGRRAALIWNTFGLIDIIFVVVSAAVLGIRAPTSMSRLTIPPLVLLPTFLVPLIIASHLILFDRLLYGSGRVRSGPSDTIR